MLETVVAKVELINSLTVDSCIRYPCTFEVVFGLRLK